MSTHTCARMSKYEFCLSLYSASQVLLLLSAPPPPAVTLVIYNFENLEHERQFYFQPTKFWTLFSPTFCLQTGKFPF